MALLVVSGCGEPVSPEGDEASDELGPETVADQDLPGDLGIPAPQDADATPDTPDAGLEKDGDPLDIGASGCDLAQASEVFESEVQPFLVACRICHDMTVPAGVLKQPGPQWYHPTDSNTVVEYLLQNDLIDGFHPNFSTFLLKPLPTSCGGVKHTGGEWEFCEGEAHSSFLAFLSAAAPCAQGGSR